MKRVQEGSITVFLSLILLLILAVTMTTVEAARVNVAKAFSERALATAMDSVLAEYYLPLFEEYHIFALDGGYGEDSIQAETIMTKLNEYMEYTFKPSKDLYLVKDYIPVQNVNLLGIETKNVELGDLTYLMDYNGDLFTGEAVGYMKYNEIGDLVESFLVKSGAIKKTQAAQTVLESKQETEEKLYEIDEKILKLMRLVDGISISEKGVKIDKKDRIVIKDSFVKKICILPSTKKNLGIENDLVYNSLGGNYVNPQQIIDIAVDTIHSLIENISLKESAEKNYSSLTSIDQSDMDDDEKEDLNREIDSAWEQVQYYCRRETELLSLLNSNLNSLNTLIRGSLTATRDALPVVDELIGKQSEVTGEINNYESILYENQTKLEEELYQGLSEDLTEMQKYKKTNTVMDENVGNYDFEVMKTTLINNEAILDSIQEYPKATVSEGSLNALKESLLSTRSSIEKYSHQGLQFNYSNLAKPVESDKFFNCISTLIEDGIMGLVVDTDKISKKEIKTDTLPTYLHKISESLEPKDASAGISGLNIDSRIGAFSDMFSDLGGDIDLTDAALTGGETFGQMLLFQEYLMKHFGSFSKVEAENTLKALEYELEYILMGRTTDYKNLKAVIMRILLIRTILNFITLIGDSKSSGEARTMAISFVGFTGLPSLVCIIKAMILSIWAFAESLVDIAALLQGKVVPLLKNGTQLQLGLYELYLLSKPFIKSKADNMKESVGALQLEYHDYLRLFLFLEGKENKCFRALDLIQENIQLKYEDNFYIKNCIFGFQAEAEFQMNEKFIALSFMKEYFGGQHNAYIFHSTQEYSY